MPSPRRARLLSLAALLLLLLLPAARGASAAPTGQVSLFAAGLDPFSKTTDIAVNTSSGVGLKLGPGGGLGGTFSVAWSERVSTSVSLSAVRLPLKLSGAGSADGGSLDFVPLTVLGERHFALRGRTRGWIGVGFTVPFIAQASLSPALRRAGVAEIRRPEHPAAVLATGLDVALSPRMSLALGLRWSPVAETLVVIPAGAAFKSQRLGVDFRPVTLSAGLAWRAF
jgi:outer membrane protein W